ncbi:MAG TPA: NAD(P)H-dependent oxidoreductase [Candidatus Saccharimonadales bacterium]|nr:NAD(P)H-dependent oxidoreductase [Candidatus Saccharimonadales bacterium]
MNDTIKILGFAGSLRKESFNRALLRNTFSLIPDNASLEIFELDGIPPFNQDTEKDMPEKVRDFKSKIRGADAILISTPEYNYSVPGILKNAIDSASRPYGDNPFDGKPVAIMSASIGMLGGARAQYHLRQIFVFLNMYPINRPEVMVNFAADKFDSDSNLLDETSKKLISELIKNLVDWAILLQK